MSEQQNDLVRGLIEIAGDDAQRKGLIDTPKRVVNSFKELYSGYRTNPESVLKSFDPDDIIIGEPGNKDINWEEMVILRNIEIYSTCEHHMLPFFGRCHIAYMPVKKVLGVSKLVRLMEVFSRRLQIQERIGKQITEALMKYGECSGAACIIEAQHFCMTSRGVQKQHSEMVTSSTRGCFRTNPSTKSEMLMLTLR